MCRHYLFRMIVATFKRLRMFRIFLATMPLMSKGGPSENIHPRGCRRSSDDAHKAPGVRA